VDSYLRISAVIVHDILLGWVKWRLVQLGRFSGDTRRKPRRGSGRPERNSQFDAKMAGRPNYKLRFRILDGASGADERLVNLIERLAGSDVLAGLRR
jgi:hypothetical protein